MARIINRWTIACLLGTVLAASCILTAPSVETGEANLTVRTLPATLYTVVEGGDYTADDTKVPAHNEVANLTWLVHVVLTSRESEPLRIEQADISFNKSGGLVWRESFGRRALERMEWITGEYDMTAEYYLTRVLHGLEVPAGPDLAPGQSLSWVRIGFARPWYARADEMRLRFDLRRPSGQAVTLEHTVPITEYRQKTAMRLPFDGVWAVNAGNDLSTGHRRTGLNGLTSVGWDFVKLGPDGSPFRTDGKSPSDFYTYGEPVLAAADGVVVDVRNDLEDFGVGAAPTADQLRGDGDLFSGNLVVVDVGQGEYTFTCHMQKGSIPVKAGDRVRSGQSIGRVGNSGYSGVPHIHFNLIDAAEWLDARGFPALFTNLERLQTGGPARRFDRANPVTGWLIRNGT